MKMKRISIGFLLILLITLSVCSVKSPSSSPPATPPVQNSTPAAAPSQTTIPTTAPAPGPSFGIMFERAPYVISPYGEAAAISLTFTNKAPEPRAINPFPPEISIIELPNLQSPDKVVRAFLQGIGELTLQTGESSSYSLNWDQKNENGKQVTPGWYSVEVKLADMSGSAASVLVVPPQGVLKKNIDVNQAQTVNGITITLQRIELTATGLKVYAYNIPPDYSLPQGPDLAPPQFMILHAFAEYSIDGGALKQTFPSGIRFLENGMEQLWTEYLDPVPRDAKILTFTITELGDWKGPWEFEIPLQ